MSEVPVLVVGAGPAGLVVALELGRRGVPVLVLEEDQGPPKFPKANATTARTMEHYRRLGCAATIRALGLPEDYPQDIAYFTRYTARELARLKGRSRAEAAQAREAPQSRWPTPEPLHRVNQMLVEAVLMAETRKHPSIDLRLGCRVRRVARDGAAVEVEATDRTGMLQRFRACHVVGADGPRSVVREAIGARYEGMAGEERDFMGGRMLNVHFRCASFYDTVRAPRAWQYWAVNRERRGLVIALDGREHFVLLVQLPADAAGDERFARESIELAVGAPLALELIGIEPWTAGFALVAERYADAGADPRLFIAGDAAHLFTPTGGQGYNTAVDDAVNLSWKIAAVHAGWGGARLLGSYEAERQPIGRRNTGFARAMADSIGRIGIPDELEEDTAAGARARAVLGEALAAHVRREFDIPGIHFGAFYGGSPIVAADGGPAPPDDWFHYVPHAAPGARAPHLWVSDGVSIFDRFGREFTLLGLAPEARGQADRFAAAARARGVPLEVLVLDVPDARALYAANWVLVRPDQHVAWRGDRLPEDPGSLIDRVRGA
jgi:2-polyprenyl-6-methoxyphenol hydroxylase-like FAD-dependent oxidoreductase